MSFSSLDTLLKVSKTTSPQKLFTYDCVTLYIYGVPVCKMIKIKGRICVYIIGHAGF